LLAERTGAAGAVQPFDASPVANLDVLDETTESHDDAGTFVAADERKFGG